LSDKNFFTGLKPNVYGILLTPGLRGCVKIKIKKSSLKYCTNGINE